MASVSKKKPLLSVIIPTYNEERDLSESIKSLQKQTYPHFEIIVVDDGSDDKTRDIASSFKEIRLYTQNHLGPGTARNLGAKKARGSILVFVDADMTFDPNYLSSLVAPILEDGSITGTTHGQEYVKNTQNIWSACWGTTRVSPKTAYKVKIFRAILRKKFLSLGGFDSKYGYADDQTFWLRDAIKPVVSKNSVCYHRNPETISQVFKQSRWIGASIEIKPITFPILREILLAGAIVLSPVAILTWSIIRIYKIRMLRCILPMPFFIGARFFGTFVGLIRKAYFNYNVR
jgi:glycosyltransferase involved in cell wall biosynthesis